MGFSLIGENYLFSEKNGNYNRGSKREGEEGYSWSNLIVRIIFPAAAAHGAAVCKPRGGKTMKRPNKVKIFIKGIRT